MSDLRRKQGRVDGVLHVFDALKFSLDGLRYAYRHEFALRLELKLGILIIPAALWLGEDTSQRMVLLLCYALIVIIEIVNSAIEAVVDRISDQPHPLSKAAKDMGSAAVLISMLAAGLVWCVALWERVPEILMLISS